MAVKQKYRLLVGTHIESVPSGKKDLAGNDVTMDRVYHAMDPKRNIIESEDNLERFNCPSGALGDASQYRKYEKVHSPEESGILPPGSLVFDPSKETLEQFTIRAERATNPTLRPQTWDPTKESLVDFTRRMTANTQVAIPSASPPASNPSNSAEQVTVAEAATIGAQSTHGEAKSGPVVKGEDAKPLTSMTEKELIRFAEEEEVDLKGAKTKNDLVKALRAAGYYQ